jgi:hypothetical protein
MKVTYVGDPRDNNSGPDPITIQARTGEGKGKTLTFKKNVPVNVDDDVGAWLSTNRHFKTEAPKADKNTRRSAEDSAADNVGDAGEEAIIGSTTGDPETATREQRVAMSEQGREPTDAQGEPGPGDGGGSAPAKASARASAKS